MNALAAASSHTQELKMSLEKLAIPPSSHEYANVMCLRMAETQALKKYLHLQNEFFEILKEQTPTQAAEESGHEKAGAHQSDT